MTRLANRFELEREIGAGGMSRVFLGRDEILDRPVAVKILRKQYGGTDIGARFQREGRTAARLSHPVVVRVYDAGESEFEGQEISYIVMEYVPGGDVKDLIREQAPLSGPRLAAMGERVAAGLAHAHERGIVHRDIKPHNILLDERGLPRLTDFGIARALDTTQATGTGAYLGTAVYSPPEQLKGEKATPKSDVYSLGVTLYEAATGELPFAGTIMEIANQHVSAEPIPPNQCGADLDEELEALILACLAKDPDARPTAETVRDKLAVLKRPPQRTSEIHAAPPPPPTRPRISKGSGGSGRRPGNSRGALALLALLAVLAIIAAAIVPAFTGSSGDGNTSGGGEKPNESAVSASRGGSGSGDRAGSSGSSDKKPVAISREKTPEPTPPPEKTPDGLTAAAADQTITDHYETAVRNPDEAWNYLSSRYQGEWGSSEVWTNQFKTLQSIEFTSGPTAEVNGETATVSFSTRAVHTDRIDTPSLTATLVDEGGKWKIDGLS